MKVYRPPALATVVIFAIFILVFYGLTTWYVPTTHSRPWIASMGVLGVPTAIWVYRTLQPFYPTRRLQQLSFAALLIFVPLLLCIGFGIGAPAITLRLMGPDTQLSTTVVRKQEAIRRCRKRIVLAEYSPVFDPLCVSAHDYEKLKTGQQVLLNARQGPLGVFVFSMETT